MLRNLCASVFFLAVACVSLGQGAQAQALPTDLGDPTLNRMYIDGYEPTVLPTVQDAEKLFSSLRPNRAFKTGFWFIQGAQCYQRAEVWTNDMAKSGIKSLKAVLWYSGWYYDWYRKNKTVAGNSAWVFHIAPVVLVGSEKEPYVLDRGFSNIEGPLPLMDWAKVFLDDPYVSDCKIINSANEYKALKDHTSYPCLIQIVPMYYYSPMLFADMEDRGDVVREFRGKDLEDAFKGLKNN